MAGDKRNKYRTQSPSPSRQKRTVDQVLRKLGNIINQDSRSRDYNRKDRKDGPKRDKYGIELPKK